jgi:hypothetical protein
MQQSIVQVAQAAHESEASHWAVYQYNATTWYAERIDSPGPQSGPQEVLRYPSQDSIGAQRVAAYHCMSQALEAAFQFSARQRQPDVAGGVGIGLPTSEDSPVPNGHDDEAPAPRRKGRRYSSNNNMTPERPAPESFE